jgi:hypothetical protein
MSDEADNADACIEHTINIAISAAYQAAKNIPAGTSGECDGCGETFARLVNGYCGRCRDKWGLE